MDSRLFKNEENINEQTKAYYKELIKTTDEKRRRALFIEILSRGGEGMYAALTAKIVFNSVIENNDQKYKNYPFGGRFHPDAIQHQEVYLSAAREFNLLIGSFFTCEFYLEYYRRVCGLGTFSIIETLKPIADKILNHFHIFESRIVLDPDAYRKLNKIVIKSLNATVQKIEKEYADGSTDEMRKTQIQEKLQIIKNITSPLDELKIKIENACIKELIDEANLQKEAEKNNYVGNVILETTHDSDFAHYSPSTPNIFTKPKPIGVVNRDNIQSDERGYAFGLE